LTSFVADTEAPTRVILDPSILFTEEALAWILDRDLAPWLVISEALWRRLEDPEAGGQFLPWAHPNSEDIARTREALASREIARFSYQDAPGVPDGARGICEALLQGDGPLGDVLADEWAFLTSQSLAVIAEQTRESLDAFRRAGGHVFEVSSTRMKLGLWALRRKLPPGLLKVMKTIGGFPRGRLPKWVVAGGEFALGLLPHVAVPLGAAELIRQGIGVIAGDP
jgi:hypothetical protein